MIFKSFSGVFPLALAIICLVSFRPAASSAPTSRKNADIARGEKIFSEQFCRPSRVPVSFTYNGRNYKGLGGLKVLSSSLKDVPGGRRSVTEFALDRNIRVTLDAFLNTDFGETEYTLWFENVGNEPGAVLENVLSADMVFKGKEPVLRGCLGDHVNKYAPYEKDLSKETVHFRSDRGRATHEVFPYFDLVHGDGGTLMALGWAGTWTADFSANGALTQFKALNCNDFKAVIMPGEKVRTALVVLLPYKGRNADDATNLWRDWFIRYNMPRADASLRAIEPFSTTCLSSDTGLPNSDGSISERFYTWKRSLERLVYEGVLPDFRWFDAGWYPDPAGNTVMSDWWGTVGVWQIDTVKWPGNSFRESNEAFHRAGMKVLMWFEPERVTHVDDLVKNHAYKAEWAISDGANVFSNNIGDPECLEWTVSRITGTMLDGGVDLFREDNNSNPGTTWPKHDGEMAASFGLPRKGITENLAIQGHYELWDRIIEFCRQNGKCTYIDNCASGGGRNDLESLRRSMPFMRSDADRTTTALRLSMSSTFNKWVPFHGANTKESKGELENGMAGGSDLYVTRASWLPIYNMSESWTHDVLLDYDRVRRTYGEWKKYSHLLLKDYYVLTPWHKPDDTSGWTVFAYNDIDTGEAILTAFRQETCAEPSFVARLPFARDGRQYRLRDIDSGREVILSGTALREQGLEIGLGEPRSCAVWYINEM